MASVSVSSPASNRDCRGVIAGQYRTAHPPDGKTGITSHSGRLFALNQHDHDSGPISLLRWWQRVPYRMVNGLQCGFHRQSRWAMPPPRDNPSGIAESCWPPDHLHHGHPYHQSRPKGLLRPTHQGIFIGRSSALVGVSLPPPDCHPLSHPSAAASPAPDNAGAQPPPSSTGMENQRQLTKNCWP